MKQPNKENLHSCMTFNFNTQENDTKNNVTKSDYGRKRNSSNSTDSSSTSSSTRLSRSDSSSTSSSTRLSRSDSIEPYFTIRPCRNRTDSFQGLFHDTKYLNPSQKRII